MRKMMLAVSAVAFLSGCVAPQGETRTTVRKLEFGGVTPKTDRTYFYSAQTGRVSAACMPERLLRILGHIREKTGVRPILTSAHRTGGRKGSMHRTCMAADIRVPGVSDASVIAAASTAPGIGGIGRYCNGIIHVDVGPKRQWIECGRRAKGLARLSRR